MIDLIRNPHQIVLGPGLLATESPQGVYTITRKSSVAACGVLTSAGAGTGVDLIPNASVPSGSNFYLGGFFVRIPGATAWVAGTGTVLRIKDKSDNVFATIDASALVAGALISAYSAGVTLSAYMTSGGAINKGMKVDTDGTFSAGSDLQVELFGYFA